MNNTKPKVCDLSIDFDFFATGMLHTDFNSFECTYRDANGHADGISIIMKTMGWAMRYAAQDDLETLYDVNKADFLPCAITSALATKGLHLDCRNARALMVADSHRYAYKFFNRSGAAPDYLVNIDAHHDVWAYGPDTSLHCGNWATALLHHWHIVGGTQPQYLSLYPNWKEPGDDTPPSVPVKLMQWKEWPGLRDNNVMVRNVFICRSPEWTPPHMDDDFMTMLSHAATALGHVPEFAEHMPERPMDRAGIADMRKQNLEALRQFKERYGDTLLEELQRGA
jgi:hypothetical protein